MSAIATNLPAIIGITGRKYSGKDTLGDFLVTNYGYERIAYADALKEVARIIFDFDDTQLYGDNKETPDEYWNITPRQAFQFIGTDLFRNNCHKLFNTSHTNKDIWIRVVKRKIMNRLKTNPNAKFVVTDIRFPDELDAVKDLGGITIKIKRDTTEKRITSLKTDIATITNSLSDPNQTLASLENTIKQLEQIKNTWHDTVKIDTHESEILIDSLITDHTFSNNKTKDELFVQVQDALGL